MAGKKRQRKFGRGKYRDVVGKRKQLTYIQLIDEIRKTNDIRRIRAMINSYIQSGQPYPKQTRSTRDTLGDCNGDGNVDILDIVVLINFVLGESTDNNNILQNCDIDMNGGINILDIVAMINIILNPPEEEDYELPPNPTLTDISNRVDYLQHHSSLPDRPSFYSTQDVPLTGDHPGWVLEPATNPNNKVLITAPHAQNHYRPTRWISNYSPESGLRYCDRDCEDNPIGDYPDCNKSTDYCTGAMAKTLAELTGASVMYTRYKQEDPSYYDNLGIDYYGRNATDNLNSGNEVDIHFPYAGIQTPAYYDEWVTQGNNSLHPFKSALGDYLEQHPEITMVIDIHGMSTNGNHQDIDIGLLGDNGSNGIITDNIDDIDNVSLSSTELAMLIQYIKHINYIGQCEYNCPDGINGNDTCIGESGCITEGICPEGMTGHGPITYNDFSAANQYSVTKFVNTFFGDNVSAVQLEINGYYRCLSNSRDNDVGRMVNALGQFVEYLNLQP